ncbi:MAG: large subunit ribosomal protein L3 [Patescibacteria group bacterium]|jgi:large subunit ribosomal protein L3
MANNNRSRKGSLQFYPRVRSKRVIPRVNWKPHQRDITALSAFIGYKVGMTSVLVKDNTPDSMTKGKRIVVPATIIECPTMKIFSVRYYKDSKVLKDVVVTNDKDLKGRVKTPKVAKYVSEETDFDDVRVIVYTQVKDTGIGKKKPDMLEIGLSGSNEEKVNWIKEHVANPLNISDVFESGLIDIHAVTKAYGTQGPMKRFGVALKSHKSEKGRRRPGSLSSFGLRRVTFRAPQAGQVGYFTRVSYNTQILQVGKITEKDINKNGGFHQYGNIKNDYIIVRGSVAGPKKRGIVMTVAQRPTKKQAKKNLEVVELR